VGKSNPLFAFAIKADVKKGQYIQINIYGWAKKNGEKKLILGEAKTSISRREISRFQKIVKNEAQLEDIQLNRELAKAQRL